MSRVRASFLTMASSTMFVAVTSLVGIVSTPLLLGWLGAARFGAFRALSDSLGYLTLLDLGLGASVMASLVQTVNQRDVHATGKTLFNAVLSYFRIVALALGCGIILVYALPSLVKAQIDPNEVRIAGAILLSSAFLLPLGVFRTLAEVQQRGSVVNVLLTIQSLVTTACLLIVAKRGWGLPGQSAAIIVAQIPTIVVLVVRGSRCVPGVFQEKRDPEVTRRLWSLNWHALVQNVCGRVALLSDNIIVSWGLGAAAVAPFYLTQRLGSLVQSQLQSLGNATWATLMELHYRDERARFAERLTELTTLVSGAGAVALGIVFAYNRTLVALWTAPQYFAGETVTLLACVNSWMWAISSLWGWPITGAGEMGRWAPWAVLLATINVTVSLALVKVLGWLGPLLGTTAGFVLVSSWAQPRLLRQIFGIPGPALWRAALKPLVWALPYSSFIYVASHSHEVQGVATFVEVFMAGAGGAMMWWLFGLEPGSRTEWQHRIRIVFARS